ncbi:hypothetical protein JDY09_03190 [Thermoleophilum album]|uniref:Wzz/FepE/Etk N-terminal domain-containing protein n=1 Tax=Thermoleophilum album TaxID=29539 RepID=UPI00237C7926|nr:Wzz/FepE/Etk N-terminal domain-containing protein [Thermoleophilum album]WDT94271.1 hypothetical protein JDY09_03190 [Thermoleophilum album]
MVSNRRSGAVRAINEPHAGGQRPVLQRYLEVLKDRRVPALVAVTACLLAAFAVLLLRPPVYEAEVDILVNPVSSSDPIFATSGVVRESVTGTRDVETVARLIVNARVMRALPAEIRRGRSVRELLALVRAQPVAESTVVAVTARGASPREASDLANAVARTFKALRDADIRARARAQIARLTANPPPPGSSDAVARATQLATLRTLAAGGDPSVQIEDLANPVDAVRIWPRPLLTLVAAVVAGGFLAVAVAFLFETLDNRIRREEHVRDLSSLPIIARVPLNRPDEPARARSPFRGARARPRGGEHAPLPPSALSPVTVEAFRLLRAALSGLGRNTRAAGSLSPRQRPWEVANSQAEKGRGGESVRGRAILITSSGPEEGKSTSALNLAAAFAMAGQSTVLLEADVHRPSLARALGISVERSVGDVLSQRASVEHALVSLPHFGGRLRGLFAKPTDAGLGDLFALAPGEQLLTDLRARADVVVVDSAPALRVGDTLQLVGKVDDVVLVVRLGVTKSEELRRLLELFDQQRLQPIGLVLIGTDGADNGYYGYAGQTRGFEAPAGVLNSVAVGQRTVRPRVYRERRINS